MKKTIILIAVLIFTSCTERQIEPNIINFEVKNNLPIIKATINGKGVKLLVDSGASSSIIDYTLKDKLAFQTYNEDGGVTYNGIGGSTQGHSVTNLALKYNDSILHVKFRAIYFKNVRNSLGVAGVLGSDYLLKNGLILDYTNKQIRKPKI